MRRRGLEGDDEPARWAPMRQGLPILLLLVLAGCAEPPAKAPLPPAAPAPGIAAPDYWRDVKPILDRRCVVCHGCYDAPCQLNLSAYEGLARGAHKKRVYDTTRLFLAEPTRLFEDATTVAQWREKGFYPVLPEPPPSGEPAGPGVLARMLALKRQHPLPETSPLPESFDFSLDRAQQCPAEREFDDFAARFPLWGMPYGLPGLTDQEQAVLTSWIAAGAPYREPAPLAPAYEARVRDWERFLNEDSPKHRLMSRYLYEHLYLADLYFDDLPTGPWFKLVRSRTAPGEPVARIATRLPYDDPGQARVHYRLEPVRTTILAKTHIPYAFGEARRARYRELFLDQDYAVRVEPGYGPAVASNPFLAFQDLPVRSRYRFLLDDAGLFVMMFIKGPSCRGQIALDVIDDRFWIFFLNPDSPAFEDSAEFLARESRHLWLPAEGQTSRLGLTSWLRYSRLQTEFLAAKQAFLASHRSRIEAAGLGLVWDGEGRNRNAALTVFRNGDNAAVVTGLVGANPKTSVVLTYQLLERVYYLLVAGFDVFGYMGHQLDTRLYMDFLRMEGEFNFLLLLPKEQREKERDFWYRDAHQSVKDYVYGSRIHFDANLAIDYRTDDPKTELFALLRHRLAGVLSREHDLAGEPDEALRTQLKTLAAVRGRSLAWMPEVAFLAVTEPGREGVRDERVYTLLHDDGYSNIASLFDLEGRRLPEEDGLTVARGLIGAYPNAFYRVNRTDLPAFVAAVAGLASEADYRRLAARWAVRRTSPGFWRQSDRLHRAYRTLTPLEAGLFDYNRLENR